MTGLNTPRRHRYTNDVIHRKKIAVDNCCEFVHTGCGKTPPGTTRHNQPVDTHVHNHGEKPTPSDAAKAGVEAFRPAGENKRPGDGPRLSTMRGAMIADVSRPVLVDLFCGPGGGAVGYRNAGFDVIGVDHKAQPNYPFPALRADWRVGLSWLAPLADAFHASPPCQKWSRQAGATGLEYPDLIADVRAALAATGKPFVIENVEGAPLENAVTLCGTQFGLNVRRHRCFETSPVVFGLLPPCWCGGRVANGELVGQRFGTETRGRTQPPHRRESERRDALQVPWVSAREARHVIPPAYTEWIGKLLLPLTTGQQALALA